MTEPQSPDELDRVAQETIQLLRAEGADAAVRLLENVRATAFTTSHRPRTESARSPSWWKP